MQVDRIRPAPATGSPRRAKRAGANGFTLPDAGEAPASAPSAAAMTLPVAGLEAAFDAAAPAQPDAEADRNAVQYGETLLQAMAQLQQALICGHTPAAREDLRKLAAEPVAAADPRLRAVLQAVAQRAAVELARWD